VKTNKTVKRYFESAHECATYIMDSDSEHISYEDYIQSGNDPRDHILFHAAVVLGTHDDFDDDIDEYLKVEEDE
jgi:hypothetical protein